MEILISPSGPGLAAGTLVTTPDGDKKIEEVVAGDLVLSGGGDTLSNFYKVEKATSKLYNGPMLRIKVDADTGVDFRATPNHICFGHVPAERMNEKSVMLLAFFYQHMNGSKSGHGISSVHSDELASDLNEAERIARRMSQSGGGLEIKRIAAFGGSNALNDNVGFQFLPATSLKVGMKIPFTTTICFEAAKITSITEEHYDGLVYDLDIPQTRNFAANGILVHDST